MSRIVEAARGWLDVPYLHQGRNRSGVDCVGLPVCVYRDLGVELPDFRAYAHESDSALLIGKATDALGEPVAVAPVRESDLQIGDIIMFRFEIEPHHVGIVADYHLGGLSFIDADGGYERVIERRLSDKYVDRITHVFRRPV